MQCEQSIWTQRAGWMRPAQLPNQAQLVLVFGARAALLHQPALDALRATYPQAQFFGCSTAGEIAGAHIYDDSIAATAIRFGQTAFHIATIALEADDDQVARGAALARLLPPAGLRHVLLLADGLVANTSAILEGMNRHLPAGVAVTGGLAADGVAFAETVVLCDGQPRSGCVAALGLYGKHLWIGYGSQGGWDSFGPERLITRSVGNVLYELDGKSALSLYKRYLGEYAHELPAAGLRFPLSLRGPGGQPGLVRTILSVDEQAQSITFAGDMPQGSYARLMKANFDRLLDGAIGAARASMLHGAQPELALLISCVGRKELLMQRIEEEVEGVYETFGQRPVLAGFYSYGEIAPFRNGTGCELHNQTMTITTLAEIP
ncbi:hypothetical protein SE17_06580 [Kouleothrix aurantiaca]|uniref:Histidine kinase n=1 Tax=Kouleothrix aurantiaca TaxID=186479 RepID=A0A0P9HGM6_9CHLR|nr:hypothetical protein SE17_06580 [Kouleothrix aurantiaca]